MDADLQYDPKYLNIFFNEKNFNYDFINSKREGRSDNFLNIFFSNVYVFFLKLLFKKKYDYFSGLKLFKKKIYNQLQYKGLVRFLLFYCIKKNLKIKEISIKHKKRLFGKSYTISQRIRLFFSDIFTLYFLIISNKKQVQQVEYFLISIFIIISSISILNFNKFIILIILIFISCVYSTIKSKIINMNKK